MTAERTLLMILTAALCTFATRVIPFLLFNGKKPVPPVIHYLGETLPPAVVALLIVYCVKNVSWLTAPHGVPEVICIITVALLHLWKRNNLLSIGVGTALYMFFIQSVFFPGS